MNENYFIVLVYKRLKAEISTEELLELNTWIASDEGNAQMAQDIEQAWSLSEPYPKPFEYDLETEFSKLQELIVEADIPSTALERKLRPAPRKSLGIFNIAAALAIFLLAGTLIWNSFFRASNMIIAVAPRGVVKQITLPDGSAVWLKGNSELKYPKSFNNKNRNVQLSGEAFFDVVENTSKPFQIETAQTVVEVLGTSFDVRALPNENLTSVIVQTGKVRFQHRFSDASTHLEKDQKGIFYHNTQRLEQTKALPNNNEIYWKTGELSFDNMLVAEVAAMLESYFQVKVGIQNEALKTCRYRSPIPFKDPELEEMLQVFASVLNAKLLKNSSDSFLLVGGKCSGS